MPGIPYDKPELMRLIRELELHSVSSVFAALAPDGREDAHSKMGLASLLQMMWADEYVDERDARFVNDRVHANIQRDGTFSVVPRMNGGVTSSAELRKIADVADKYAVPMIKLTGGQRIDLLGLRKEDLPAVWADLDMPSGFAYGKSFRTVKTCVGSDFCRFGVGDSTSLGIAIEERFQGIAGPGKMKLAVTGCPRNCAEALCKDLGVVAVDGGRWEIYVGGAAGAHIRKGDLLATVESPDEVIRLTGRFLQQHGDRRQLARTHLRLGPRFGIDRIRAVVVDDSDGIGERLDAEMQRAVDAYRDPWKDGARPGNAGSVPHLATADRAAASADPMTAHVVGTLDEIPDRGGTRLRRRRHGGRGVSPARRVAAGAGRGLPAQGRPPRRRADGRARRGVPATRAHLRPEHRHRTRRRRCGVRLRRYRRRRRHHPRRNWAPPREQTHAGNTPDIASRGVHRGQRHGNAAFLRFGIFDPKEIAMTASETIPKTRTRSHHIADWDPEDVPAWLAGGNKIARRNLIWSVLAEHIGFSVWSDLAELLAEKVRIVESKVKSGAANPARNWRP